MTEQTSQEARILVEGDSGAAYWVPLAVLEAHQATPEQRAQLQEAMGDTAGSSLEPDAPTYLLTAEVLEPYRISNEQRDALQSQQGDAASDDVAGFQFIGVFPPKVAVRSGREMLIWSGSSYAMVSPNAARDPALNADADYYPPLR